ncbi:protein-glutamate methylesterase/protein-glutamine glutaminase [Gracilinema caldarium]|uniref:Protein-glutamate methylesterase/protein-glutamine glutaminase n=1 Tax=Gracilinema caldarium (strain ATCC 51460 / DSM 7334 / H1) TaxID=744872 RepID=F8F090_GRAC1|nr:chemotaxis response regulator protein-glutamate methylesterase [Gracilinema caldarium]AEJ18954.1 response regulator receiver modulated CheB methylesterase [Gracilinema caldarium DSM 7334]
MIGSHIKVLIVDDSAVVRQTLSEVLESDRLIKVIGTAMDPIFALKKIQEERPDVIISDVEMPRMDGLSFLKQIMSEKQPIPIVICSSKTETGSENALKALEYGAVDIIQKPKLGTKEFLEESKVRICDAVKAAYHAKVRPLPQYSSPPVQPKLTADVILPKPEPIAGNLETTEKIIVVGASTGGTEALREFLEVLPVDAPGIVIVQHMPEHFTTAFAKRLDGLCKISVKEAEDNDTVLRGRALIAPGNKHTLLKRAGARYYVEVKDGPLVCRHRPSVDVLFRSAARYAGKNAVAVIMTGMGDDGSRGMKELHEVGAYTIAQDEATCVVFGMPNEAIKVGAVDIVLPLPKIALEVLRRAY